MSRSRALQAVAAILVAASPAQAQNVYRYGPDVPLPLRNPSVQYLARVMDQYHAAFHVYDDFISAGNHFAERGRMCNAGDEDSVPPMDEAWAGGPRSGLNCIRCEFKARRSNWGGWFFMNGTLTGAQHSARLNWGTAPGGGHDLTGATRLTFWARGEEGGEKVRFFAFGIGRQPFGGKAVAPHPDSSPQAGTPYVTLTREWQEYAIDVAGLDLTNVLLGFAWQTKATVNRHRDIVFYLDDISYDLRRPALPRLLVSYRAERSSDEFDLVLRNCAFTYDNALALLAFLSAGDVGRARLIADALVYAQSHDRWYSDGRLRNGYQGGDLALPPGCRPNGRRGAARLPGWWDAARRTWREDRFAAGTYAGNMAWVILALCACHETAGGDAYLAAAVREGEWIERHCRDELGAGGYTAGYEGWEPEAEKLSYKSTEHNLDLCAAFERLYRLTRDPAWMERARHARRFVQAMWDPEGGKFWTGTGNDGATPVRSVVPVDAQAWALLALGSRAEPCRRALDYAELHHRAGAGFDFNQDADGTWFEGTAHMALAFAAAGEPSKWQRALGHVRLARDLSGGVPAASRDAISTGFHLQDGTPWLYYKRLHVGATAWFVLAENRANPFWLGSGQAAVRTASL